MVFNKSCVLCNGHWCCDGLKHLRSQSRKIKFEQGWSQEALRVVQEKGREMLEDPARVLIPPLQLTAGRRRECGLEMELLHT